MIVNTIAGVKGTDRRLVQAAQTMGVGRFASLRTVILPAALAGMR
jgi:sulfonate transport system permease protein